VHTGQAIGGEKYTQAMGTEYVRQQAATKVDLMPQVQTQLGPQEVVNVPANQPAQFFGKTTVLPSQQATTTTTTAVTGGLSQLGGLTGNLGAQTCGTQPGTFGTQPLGAQAFGTQPLGAQTYGAQNLTTQTTGTQPLSTPLGSQQTGLGSNLNIGKKNY